MPKKPLGQKRKATKVSERPSSRAISRWENEGGATQKLPRKLPDDSLADKAVVMRNATGEQGKPKRKA